MKILLLVREGSGCDYHRVVLPMKYLPLESGEKCTTVWSNEQNVRVSEFKAADIVMFNRHPTIDLDTILTLKKKHGFKIWCDVDDYWELPPSHYLYDNWKRLGTSEKILRSISTADILTVTNKALLTQVKDHNPKVVIIPNALPMGYEQFSSNKTESTRVRFMYAGGASHERDLKSISGFFAATGSARHFMNEAEFILAGYNRKYVDKSLHAMNDIISKAANYSVRDGLRLEKYMEHYDHTDISIAPLEYNYFNGFKSNLKIIEAGCMRTPIVCSKVMPYTADNEMNGKGVFFCERTADWYNTCMMFLEEPTSIITWGDNLYNYVKEKYDLVKINEKRREIINSFKK